MATKKQKADPQCWTQHVMETSNALDLEKGVFTLKDPREIALSLQRSAESSQRRKSSLFRSAMSMLTFHINRAGKKMPKEQLERLEDAKDELRPLYGKEQRSSK
jgi:polyhydroxyalkanoate synthesis regulator protein